MQIKCSSDFSQFFQVIFRQFLKFVREMTTRLRQSIQHACQVCLLFQVSSLFTMANLLLVHSLSTYVISSMR